MSVNLSTVEKWIQDVDSLGEWLCYMESCGKVTQIFCTLCTKHHDHLRSVRNFITVFVVGLTGTSFKKDVNKPWKSDMHTKAVNPERKPTTVEEIYRSTPLGRSLAVASVEQTSHVCKLSRSRTYLRRKGGPLLSILQYWSSKKTWGCPWYIIQH